MDVTGRISATYCSACCPRRERRPDDVSGRRARHGQEPGRAAATSCRDALKSFPSLLTFRTAAAGRQPVDRGLLEEQPRCELRKRWGKSRPCQMIIKQSPRRIHLLRHLAAGLCLL